MLTWTGYIHMEFWIFEKKTWYFLGLSTKMSRNNNSIAISTSNDQKMVSKYYFPAKINQGALKEYWFRSGVLKRLVWDTLLAENMEAIRNE